MNKSKSVPEDNSLNEIDLIRKQKHQAFLLERRKEELFEILKNKLEFNELKRKFYIIQNFLKKYYTNKYAKSELVSIQHDNIKSISGIKRKHIKTKKLNIIVDIEEIPVLTKLKMIPARYKKKFEKDIKNVKNIIYIQNFEYRKALYVDTIKSNRIKDIIQSA
jgi:hypothetical protein